MGIGIKVEDVINILGLKNAKKEVVQFFFNVAKKKIDEEAEDRSNFELEVSNYSDEELAKYIPTVYQEDIYDIDYDKLKGNGIKLISFDIDDTISDSGKNKFEDYVLHKKITLPKKAQDLFKKLKDMGITVVLVTNARNTMAEGACEVLDADDYIARAKKPEVIAFERLQKKYGVEKREMAHIGNSMRQDIKGGNDFGITTCLIRRAGFSMKIVKFGLKMMRLKTKGHIIREELKKRGLWRKHHKCEKGDQYYQLGEKPKYLS